MVCNGHWLEGRGVGVCYGHWWVGRGVGVCNGHWWGEVWGSVMVTGGWERCGGL